MQFDRARRCHAVATVDLTDADPQRADVAAVSAKSFHTLGDQPGNRGLAIGSCNTNDTDCV